MVLAVLVFLLVAGAVVGGYWAIAYLPARIESRRLDKRLADVTQGWASADGDVDLRVRRSEDTSLPPLQRFLDRTGAGGSLGRLIQQSGVRTTPGVVVMLMVVIGLAAALTAQRFGGFWFLGPLVGIPAAFLPILFLLNRRGARLRRFEEQFPEALDLLSRALRAGHAFQAALGMAGQELAPPVGPELKTTFEQQNFGLALRDSMEQLVDRIPSLDVRFFVIAVMIQRESGGNLSEILDNLGRVVRDRFKLRRQIRTHTAHARFTAFVLLALPAALAVILTMISPEHMKPLFEEGMGRTLILGAAIMQTMGFFWIRKIIRIEV